MKTIKIKIASKVTVTGVTPAMKAYVESALHDVLKEALDDPDFVLTAKGNTVTATIVKGLSDEEYARAEARSVAASEVA